MASYPPVLSTETRNYILKEAIDWAMSQGLVVRLPLNQQLTDMNDAAVTHAPFALHPTPFPRKEYEKAISLQKRWNTLIHDMSQDKKLIAETMETLSKLDDFMNKLYQIYLFIQKEGPAQSACLGIHRNDYLLHVDKSSAHSRIQQVEINTIASSFGCLSTKTTQLHRYLFTAMGEYAGDQIKMNQLPDNQTMESIAQGLADAWKLYNNPKACIAMIVQPNERNAFDQRWIEYTLFNNHRVLLKRFTLSDIATRAKIHPVTKALTIDGWEIAVSYFRAGYGPEDYPTSKEWDARLMIERSLAIKCPNIDYQLIGSKKVQQVLTESNRLERYVDKNTANNIRETFAGLYPLDDSPAGIAAYKKALANPDDYVLKPQREGGGHNHYGQDIVNELKKMSVKERNAYILMDLIRSPPLKNCMVRAGVITECEVVSELGIYGIYLRNGQKEVSNKIGGHLLRTKAITTKEGGVAAGFAVIDSPLLT
ncbi:glutathione synthase [Pilobolus umbonatus]|nr:glutathione synthase [Pilobolus umbonatus]